MLEVALTAGLEGQEREEGVGDEEKGDGSQDQEDRENVGVAEDFDSGSITSLPSSASAESTPPAESGYTSLPTTSCLFCHASLTHLSDVDALNHRRLCIQIFLPPYCPICSTSFSTPDWNLFETLRHLHNCQHSGSFSVIDHKNFETLFWAWRGYFYYLERLFIKNFGGQTKDWGVLRRKREEGWGLSGVVGRYERVRSGLRVGRMEMNGVTEIGRVDESDVPLYVKIIISEFRRSRFGVLRMPVGTCMPENFRVEVRSVVEEMAWESETE